MTTKKKPRPPLTPLGDLLVLGGRYRFGRGSTWNKQPVLYMSIPHKPGGLTVMADDLWAFHKKLGEMIELGFPELRGEPPPPVTTMTETALKDMCPGPGNAGWRYINEIEGGLVAAPELFVTHTHNIGPNSTVCGFCTFDTAKVAMYEDTARELRLSEEGEPAEETVTPSPKRKKGERSVAFP